MTYANAAIKKDVLWLISNTVVNSEQDALSCLDPGLIFHIVLICSNQNSMNMRKEALWCLANICEVVSSEEHLNTLLNYDVVVVVHNMLEKHMDHGSVSILAITTIRNLITKSDECLKVFIRLKGADLLKMVELSCPFYEVC